MKIFASSLMPAGLIARAAAGKRSAGGVAPADQRAVLCVDTGAGAREARAFEHPLRGDVVRRGFGGEHRDVGAGVGPEVDGLERRLHMAATLPAGRDAIAQVDRSEEHTSELPSLMSIS